MDLVNDLSSEVALAVVVDGRLRQKLGVQDAISFIAAVEAELARFCHPDEDQEKTAHVTRLSH